MLIDALNAIDAFSETVGTANRAVSAITGAVDGIKALVRPAKGRSDEEVEMAFRSLVLTVENAQLRNVVLQKEIAVLESEIRRADSRQQQLASYDLCELKSGFTVYVRRDPNEPTKIAHMACPNCHNDGQISILQGRGLRFECHRCKAAFTRSMDDPMIHDD